MSILVTYKYTAISKSGAKVKGVVEGFNELDAIDRIKQNCNIVLKITPVKERDENSILAMQIGNPLNVKAFTVMCSQFAIILRAGIPVGRATYLIAEKTTNKYLKKMLQQVASDVESGRSLAASFADRGAKLLPATFVETIRAGEESGDLAKSFDIMHKHYDKQLQTRGKVKSALTYPIFVLIIAIAVVIVLMVKVVPTFTSIFAGYGAELPAITRLLIAISNFFANAYIYMAAVLVFGIIAVKVYGKSEQGRLNIARLMLKMPVLGNINRLNAACQFANTMSIMLSAGLPLTRAVSITANVIDNYFIGKQIGMVSGRIAEGRSFGESVRETGCMPDILNDMVAVGEETGEMEDTLGTIGAYYDAELDMAINSALKKLEPTILVLLAGVAGFIVIAIYMAMFQMYAVM